MRTGIRTGIVLLARTASTRLPGKALATIGQAPALVHCLRRLQASGVGPVVLATTDRADDDALASLAQEQGATVVRGGERDVLGRMAQAVREGGFEVAFRATGDNPAVDPDGPRRLLDAWRRRPADYACERGLPVGAGVELVTGEALARADRWASGDADREHVTTFIKRATDRFDVAWLDAPAEVVAPDLRLTLDTPADLQYLRRVFEAAGADEPPLRRLIEAARLENLTPTSGLLTK
jgi:spore coat polysaccharide biosynthesis protein SpsF